MHYIYPYHQALGFYLEKAGYEKQALVPFLKMKQVHKFYLTYNMRFTEFDPRWNLFILVDSKRFYKILDEIKIIVIIFCLFIMADGLSYNFPVFSVLFSEYFKVIQKGKGDTLCGKYILE